jgi:hypothetical protein
MPRARMVLQSGETRAFAPVSRSRKWARLQLCCRSLELRGINPTQRC